MFKSFYESFISPSVGALRRLWSICEAYAESHGFRYNANKTEYMVFKAGTKTWRTIMIWTGNLSRWLFDIICSPAGLLVVCKRRKWLSFELTISLITRATCGSDICTRHTATYRSNIIMPWECCWGCHGGDGFGAIIRKSCASLLARFRGSTNSVLRVFFDRWDTPIIQGWVRLYTLVNMWEILYLVHYI